MLAAAVGAAGNVQFELLIELRQPLFHLFHQPARKTLGLGDGELAELGTGAGNCAAQNMEPSTCSPIVFNSSASAVVLLWERQQG